MIFTQSEATASLRRFYLYLVDATDGITPETGETGGQPQISKAGGAFANTTATLTHINNGSYYVELTATELNTLGGIIVRYKSAATAEFSAPGQVAVPSLNTAGTGFPAVDASNQVRTLPSFSGSGATPTLDITVSGTVTICDAVNKTGSGTAINLNAASSRTRVNSINSTGAAVEVDTGTHEVSADFITCDGSAIQVYGTKGALTANSIRCYGAAIVGTTAAVATVVAENIVTTGYIALFDFVSGTIEITAGSISDPAGTVVSTTGAVLRIKNAIITTAGLSCSAGTIELYNCLVVGPVAQSSTGVIRTDPLTRITGTVTGTITRMPFATGSIDANSIVPEAINLSTFADGVLPDNFPLLGINASGHVSRVTTTDTVTALGTNAITPTAIQDAAFTDAKFGAGFIKNTSLENDAITAGKIAAGAITSAKFAAGAINAAAIAASALNGKGDWNVGKTGYTLTQSFPANFASLGINASGHISRVTLVDNSTAAPDSAGTTTLLTRVGGSINVTDLNNTTTRFLTMIVIEGAVYQFTANALELAPAGGGGTADWTADERTAIRAILGVPGSGTTPVTPTTGMLDTINDNIASLSAGSGSGAFVVTLTVTDGTNPLQNAIVRLTEGANTFRATTNASGVATFSLNTATYTRSITRDGYTFTPNTLAVSGTTSSTSAMTATTIPPPADPDGCTVTIRARTQQLVAQAGVIIGFRYISLPAGSGMALPVNPLLITTDSSGDATAELLQGATIKFWRGKEPALANSTNTFTVPAASTYTLPDLLGEDAT